MIETILAQEPILRLGVFLGVLVWMTVTASGGALDSCKENKA